MQIIKSLSLRFVDFFPVGRSLLIGLWFHWYLIGGESIVIVVPPARVGGLWRIFVISLSSSASGLRGPSAQIIGARSFEILNEQHLTLCGFLLDILIG